MNKRTSRKITDNKISNKISVSPAKRICGTLSMPGDKSVSHRAAIIAAMAHDGASRIENFATGADCASTVACLRRLGVRIEQETQATYTVEAAGAKGFRQNSSEPLDCGNSGSTVRMLAGVLAGQNLTSILTGDDSLKKRPMKRIVEPLRLMGAGINAEADFAPLKITGRHPLRSISYEMPTASAQVKSCILLAGLNALGRTSIIENRALTRDHTERLLHWFGVEVGAITVRQNSTATNISTVDGPAQFAARDVSIPGDISSAAFFLVAAAILAGSELEIIGVGINPTRSQILDTLGLLGVEIKITNERIESNEPVGDIFIKCPKILTPLQTGANVLTGAVTARLIDELPILAVLGTQIRGGIEIRDAEELRVKESDRIAATAENLRRMGAAVEELEDGLIVDGPVSLHGASLDSFGDHRIAMAFTIAALSASGDSEIIGADCARISLPEFSELLESVIER